MKAIFCAAAAAYSYSHTHGIQSNASAVKAKRSAAVLYLEKALLIGQAAPRRYEERWTYMAWFYLAELKLCIWEYALTRLEATL